MRWSGHGLHPFHPHAPPERLVESIVKISHRAASAMCEWTLNSNWMKSEDINVQVHSAVSQEQPINANESTEVDISCRLTYSKQFTTADSHVIHCKYCFIF